MKLDILAIGVHPDDVELGCGGTLIKHQQMGLKVGVLDLTRGELGTRGTAEIRDREAADAAKFMKLHIRENVKFADGFFTNDESHQREVMKILRKYQPDIVLTNAHYDRHPDHGRASRLTTEACFLSGLSKIETMMDGKAQSAWRPDAVYHYIQALNIEPHFVVDISEHMEHKMEAIASYKSQFYDPASKEPETFISDPTFLQFVRSRAQTHGSQIGVRYGEGFTTERYIGVANLQHLL